jgi:hypothetical protein
MELNGCPRGALTHRGVVQRVVEGKSRGVLSQGRSNGQREIASVVLTLLFSAQPNER